MKIKYSINLPLKIITFRGEKLNKYENGFENSWSSVVDRRHYYGVLYRIRRLVNMGNTQLTIPQKEGGLCHPLFFLFMVF